ncbi:uncharacterized protein LOC143346422 isoform X2 [Colletes latitarsis]|uniref:uncharacterized protein LOC143346422 isoform X2 n=1 Tax=Colletes latitarsis TaxID=2605962 RepID=UPI00403720F7
MSIDASFYKNVFLLMQAVPASFECRKQFKKGMFNKPNTCGFIHVSHYLLSVHNSKQFQKMVKWPIIDKTNVKRYRAEIKDYLEVLAQENPDINFPPILMCYLVHAGGIRLLNIMWKVSEISLRAYIGRKYHATLLQAPKPGDNYNITKAYLTKINLKRNITISKCYEKTKFITKVFKLFMLSRIDNLKNIQTDIFNTMENIEKCIHVAPVRSSDKTELRNIENSEIINSWETNINESIKFIQKQNANLNKVKILSDTLHNLILNLFVDCTIFDGNNLPNVNTEILPLCFNNNVQHVNDGLYKNGCLIFHTVSLIFNQVLKHMKCYLENDIPIDISSCESTIIEHCKIMKSMEESFRTLIVEVTDTIRDKKCSLQQKSINFTSEINILHSTNLKIIFSPLKLNLSTNLCDNVEKLYERLYFTPEKDINIIPLIHPNDQQ